MNKLTIKLALAACCAAAVLAGCGGGGAGDDTTGGGRGGSGGDVPLSALQDVPGLIAYMRDLISNGTNAVGDPVALGNAVLPTSDTVEPLPVR